MPITFQDCAFGYRRNRPVLHDLTLTFPTGRTVFLGVNGAGKSTVLSLAATVLRPAAGHVRHGALRTDRRADLRTYRRQVAWLPQQVSPVPGLTVREQVAYAGWLKGMRQGDARQRAPQALAQVEMEEFADHRTTQLSGGQLRRVAIAQALVHDAEVLLLDEPTAGLDLRQRRVFQDVLHQLPPHVHAIVSTHDVADVETDFEQVVVLDAGEVLFTGPVAGFLDHAPAGTPAARRAEEAFHALTAPEPACAS
ncbi:ATP-binding cassette domain-containing protein [Streptomyces sp. JH002]|uniref:ATP-binding cassette domain-containing protein n=1 Tax=Streptomyces sp. JH002 TaxID=2763259 RepID=UPI003D802A58